MRYLGHTLSVALVAMALQIGCQDNYPSTPRAIPPEIGRDTLVREVEAPKPLPREDFVPMGPQPFYDEPLVVDQPAEAKAFVEMYNKVNRPRILIFVNRTLDGQIMPSQGLPGPERITERTRSVAGSEKPERESTVEFLKPGEYDEVDAKAIDYNLIELQLADWLGADGRVTMVSPTATRRHMTPEQLKALESGSPGALTDLASDTDILVQIQARPTRQTGRGLEIRLVAEAMNVRGGESLARAAVDIYTPLEKTTVNRFTRFLARKLMDGMIQNWTQPPPRRVEGGAVPGQNPADGPAAPPPARTEQNAPAPKSDQPAAKPWNMPRLSLPPTSRPSR